MNALYEYLGCAKRTVDTASSMRVKRIEKKECACPPNILPFYHLKGVAIARKGRVVPFDCYSKRYSNVP